ncbi:hypothetical protein C2U55_09910 [Enterobacteriaceae bacterium ENNIH3]|nr:hypothetical protein C2U55_09910 [Enterobacteriaceae bacterium ENNIH3]AUV05284.1 hypothetical protein C2U52_02800 [Enterobacteriaceae bacterium ENNIH2]PTA92253.1 hypothetical protein C9415_19830 [Kluyvera sp. Nf5]PWF52149.1 hypothetical protein BHT19_0014920 [[Kluyvera] intestini]
MGGIPYLSNTLSYLEPVPLPSLFFIPQVVSLLAALPRTSHIVHYAAGASRICRRDTTRIILNN